MAKQTSVLSHNPQHGVKAYNSKAIRDKKWTIGDTSARQKWDQDDYIYKGHICYAISLNSLFDQYHKKKTAKEIWEALEAKCMLEDTTSKIFFVSKFFQYRMVDRTKVIEQFHETTHIPNQFLLKYFLYLSYCRDKVEISSGLQISRCSGYLHEKAQTTLKGFIISYRRICIPACVHHRVVETNNFLRKAIFVI